MYFHRLLRNSALKRGTTHLTAKILLVHHCTAISAMAELLLYMDRLAVVIINGNRKGFIMSLSQGNSWQW